MKYNLIVAGVFVAVVSISCSGNRYSGSLTPEEALNSFSLDSGFSMEVFAAEPLVMDPVEMVFDQQGRIYVVEMGDYPYKPEAGKGKGRIKLLEDTDGDGRADSATVFADSLADATSVLPWKDGLIVTAAPHILYLKDTNGDNRADTREVLFSGFFENNSEAQITNLRFGVDNWIYASNNGQAGEISFSRKPGDPAVSVRGADFRFRLDKELFEAETGPAQFGQALNDLGHRFMTQNTIHIQHAVIPWRYLHRHPYMPSVKGVTDISDHGLRMFQQTPPPYWREQRSNRRQKQYDERGLDRTEYLEDHFTGASGGTFYAGDAFPASFYGNIFTGDVSGNLVHRDVLKLANNSPTYVAGRAGNETEREFLSSTDPWFRPVNFSLGPDGCLYVIDMYRQHIETPVSIPEDLKEDMDFMNGSQMGRIYRIVPKGGRKTETPAPDLESKESAQLLAYLSHPNRWWRLQAQRLLLERQDKSVIPSLKELFSGDENPKTRLHALYALEGLDALDAALVLRAMEDPDPGVREHGVLLSERYPECLPQLIGKAQDSSVRVAFQAALSLGEFPADEVGAALAGVLARHGEDAWFRMAVLSSEAGSSLQLLDLLVSGNKFFGESAQGAAGFLDDFSYILGARCRNKEILRFLKVLSGQAIGKEGVAAALTGLKKGLEKGLEKIEDRSTVLSGVKEALQAMQAGSGPEVSKAAGEIIELTESGKVKPAP